MALRVAVVICTTCFLLGILFVHWIADSLTLWQSSVSDSDVWTAAAYYALFARARPEQGYLLATIVTLGAATILWSFGDGAAENLMFDGASIFLYGTAIAAYLYKILPSFDGIFSALPSPDASSPTPPNFIAYVPALKPEVLNLAVVNLVCSVALTGVMMLQAARWWAEKSDAEDDERERIEREQERKKDAREVASPASRTKQTSWEAQGAKMASTLATANGKHGVVDARR